VWAPLLGPAPPWQPLVAQESEPRTFEICAGSADKIPVRHTEPDITNNGNPLLIRQTLV
jgi:hypothetical protein